MKFTKALKKFDDMTTNTTTQTHNGSFKEMLRYANRNDYIVLTIGVSLCVLNGAIAPLNSIFFRGMSDALMRGQAEYENGTLNIERYSDVVLYNVRLYGVLGVVMFIIAIVSMGCLLSVCERQIHLIRQHFFAAVLRQDIAWFDRNETGALTTKMAAGIDRIKEGMGDKLGVLIQSSANFVFGIVVGLCYSWKITLVMMAIVPFIMISLYGSARALTMSSRRELYAHERAGGIASEVLQCMSTVTAFNAQYNEVARYSERLKEARNMGMFKAFITAIFTGVFLFVMFGSMGFVFWYGTSLVLAGEITPGTVFAVFWAVLGGAIRLGQAAPQIGVIIAARLAASDIFAIIDREPEIDSMSADGLCPTHIEGRIELCNINFRYPSREHLTILKDISFKVEPGETVALVGHSGCGKSTIVGLILRYYDQQAGTLTIDGVPIRDLNIEWLRNTVGVVSQEPILFAASIEENLRMGNESATERDMIEACTAANAHNFITKLPRGYKTVIGCGGIQLSGGQKQKIAIARALIRNPKILLLDEATSALDTESEVAVQRALDQAREGRTTLVVAHRLSTIRGADKIIVFSHGEIAEMGTHAQLMSLPDGVYRRLVRAQQFGDAHEEFIDEDVESVKLTRGPRGRDGGYQRQRTEEDELAECRKERLSQRLRESIGSLRVYECETERDNENIRDELADEGAKEASLLQILKFSKKELPTTGVAMLFTVIRGLAWPVFAIIYGRTFLALSAIDAGETSKSTTTLNSIWFIVLGILTGLSTFASGTLFGWVGERMSMRLRIAVFTNVLRQDGPFFDSPLHSVGKLADRLATDAQYVKAAIDQRLAEVLQGVVSLLAGITVAFCYGWNMAPIGLLTCALLIALQTAVTQYLKFRGADDIRVATHASQLATESIDNVRTIQALTRQRHVYNSFCLALDEPHRRAIIRGIWQALNYAMSNSFMMFNFAISYWFGLWLVQNGWTQPFIVFQVVEALNMASVSVLAAASYFPEYVRGRLSAGLMFHMMNRIPKIDNLSEAGSKEPIRGDVQLRDVYFTYPARRDCLVLNHFSVSAPVGRTIALVGPSGSGKSTVVQLLERFYDPTNGAVLIDGRDIRHFNIRHIRANMSLVSQQPALFNMSIRDNITYGLDEPPTQTEIEQAAKTANIHGFIRNLPEGYDTIVGPKGVQLSGGQKQRIAIARAIIRNPKILILDEATSALDTENELVVQDALNEAQRGRTCLVIAHRLSTIQNAHLIVVLREGRVVESGTHTQLLARKGLYFRLIQNQKLH